MSDLRFIPLGPLDSGPSSRAFLGYERGEPPQSAPLWPIVMVWVPEDVEEDPDRMQQLREDTERAAQIDHPNVIRVIGCEQLDEGFARVVEYADAESLRGFLNTGAAVGYRLPPPFLLRVVADAAAGVHHVHEMGHAEGNVRGRLHGALRPETLLVGFDGVTKVTGYGALAVAPRDVFGARLSPRLQYLSPEEIEGGTAATDRRSDVYGLGLILYEALAGRLPYRIEDPDVEQRLLVGDLPMEALGDTPPLLQEVIAKALARTPADRFPTTDSLRRALESLGPWTAEQVAQLCTHLVPESSPQRSGRRQLMREIGFPPGPWPRPTLRAKPRRSDSRPTAPPAQSARPAQPAAPVTPALPVAPPAANPAPRPAPRISPVLLTPAPPPPSGPPIAAMVVGGLVVTLLLLGMLFLMRPDLWRTLVRGTPPPEIAVASVKAAPVLPADIPPEPLPLPPPGPVPATLELSSDPPLQVSVDGKPHGTTPQSFEVAAGDHRVRFRDAAKGIDIERVVHAKEGGHHKVPVRVSHASMEVTAPPGAQVFLDGKFQGKAPVQALKFFEGRHSIKVKMGKAVFDRQFTAQAGEALTLNVSPNGE